MSNKVVAKCKNCVYAGPKWLISPIFEVICPKCKRVICYLEQVRGDERLSYLEAIELYDRYEDMFIHHSPLKKTSWAELDVALNESIARRITSGIQPK